MKRWHLQISMACAYVLFCAERGRSAEIRPLVLQRTQWPNISQLFTGGPTMPPPHVHRTVTITPSGGILRREGVVETSSYEEREFVFSASTRFKLSFVKVKNNTRLGTEYMPVMVHAAGLAKDKQNPCVVVDAGAQNGALAMVAARSGCEVYAFEGDDLLFNNMQKNLRLNNVSSSQVHIFHKNVSDLPGHRIDEDVPFTKHITVLKIDIGGPDVLAMRGAKKLFQAAGVDFLSLKIAPVRHLKFTPVTDEQYLNDVRDLGFDAYLLNCDREGDPEPRLFKTVGARCLSMNTNISSMYVEPLNQTAFLACMMQGKCGSVEQTKVVQASGLYSAHYIAPSIEKQSSFQRISGAEFKRMVLALSSTVAPSLHDDGQIRGSEVVLVLKKTARAHLSTEAVFASPIW